MSTYTIKDKASLLRPWPNKDVMFFAEELFALLTSESAVDLSETPTEEIVPPAPEIPGPIPIPTPAPFETASIEARTNAARSASRLPPYLFTPQISAPKITTTNIYQQSLQTAAKVVVPGAFSQETTFTLQGAFQAIEELRKQISQPDQQQSTFKAAAYQEEEPLKKKPNEYSSYPVPFGPTATLDLVGGGNKVYMGKVNSGKGDTYEVYLYQSGPDGSPDQNTVEVKIPQIDKNEEIPKDTWLTGIIPFTDSRGNVTFSCQPPVWLA